MLKKFNLLYESVINKTYSQKEMIEKFAEKIREDGDYYHLNDEQSQLRNKTQSDILTFFNIIPATEIIQFYKKDGSIDTIESNDFIGLTDNIMDGDEIFKVTKEQLSDYVIIPKQFCPICKSKKTGSCRCSGPHTLEQLKKGHGNHCKNNHRWSGDLTYDASED